MKVVLLTGNNPRHYHIAKQIEKTGWLAGHVVEQREAFIPEPPAHLSPHLKSLFIKHFSDRAETEERFFGEDYANKPSVPHLHVTKEELNTSKVWEFVKSLNCDLAISYGVNKLSDETLSHLPETAWNSHGGLSPWYRGCITHFWPSYMLEPQMTGMTLHKLTSQLDAGPIVHHSLAKLVRGDGIHDLACRAVKAYGEDLPRVLAKFVEGTLKELIPQKSAGKLWVDKDWRPEHLEFIYDFHKNRIVDKYLDQEIKNFEPKVISQLD